MISLHQIFQSTPPARGATAAAQRQKGNYHISIHDPREGGDLFRRYAHADQRISIHAPREGATVGALMERERVYFISIHAPPRGGRPLRSTLALISTAISIHAPREGGDVTHFPDRTPGSISIHAPREGGDLK